MDELARSFRVITFPLSGEPASGAALKPRLGFDTDARLVLRALDRFSLDRAAVCGISFGGLAAIRFAATHPERTSALILVSAPGPGWRLRPRHQLYGRHPWLFGPLFLAESPFRLRRELAAALPDRRARWRFAARQLAVLVRKPLSPARMAARAALLMTTDIAADCRRIEVPTLLVTGEPDLDRVVPVEQTLAYLKLICGARHAQLAGTGHLGPITRPAEFARLVREFVAAAGSRAAAPVGAAGRAEAREPLGPESPGDRGGAIGGRRSGRV